jgi:hypothetical protein
MLGFYRSGLTTAGPSRSAQLHTVSESSAGVPCYICLSQLLYACCGFPLFLCCLPLNELCRQCCLFFLDPHCQVLFPVSFWYAVSLLNQRSCEQLQCMLCLTAAHGTASDVRCSGPEGVENATCVATRAAADTRWSCGPTGIKTRSATTDALQRSCVPSLNHCIFQTVRENS